MAKKQYAVIGLGRFGSSLALTLNELGYDVMGIDLSEQVVQTLSAQLTHVVAADARNEAAMKSLGIQSFDTVVVAFGDDVESNILVTVMLKEIGVPYVVSKAHSPLHGLVLEKIGADKVVFPEKDMGIRIAHTLVSSNFLDNIELRPDYSIIELKAPQSFIGKTLGEINIHSRFEVTVLAMKKAREVVLSPDPETVVGYNDTLIIIGDNDKLESLPE